MAQRALQKAHRQRMEDEQYRAKALAIAIVNQLVKSLK